MSDHRPAWYRESGVLRLPAPPDPSRFDPRRPFGTSTGAGVRIAVIDSGIEADHPALDDAIDVDGAVEFVVDDNGAVSARTGPHDDVYGHGTACAGIIHALAPEATITSIRVLDSSLRGRAAAFLAGLDWAVDEGFDVINLSLGAAKRDWALAFHDTCDRGYFNNSFIVTAANNVRRESFPSLYASVTSVAANGSSDPLRFHFNPDPPTEFLARGVDVTVPWLGGTTIVTTGNSFAAPHIAAFAALIKAENPDLRPFQVKTALWAAAANVREALDPGDRFPAGARRRTVTSIGHATRSATSTPPPPPPPPPDPRATIGPPTSAIDHRHADPRATLGPPTSTAGRDGGDGRAPDPVRGPVDERAEVQAALPDYEVGEVLARGPWGPVFEATHHGRPVALRRLDESLAADGALRARFRSSVRIASELLHPHLLPIVELRETDRCLVVAMPRCPANLLTMGAELDPPSVVAAAISLLDGLQVAHRHGIYHGDLRPENALVDGRHRVVVSDVGIAAALSSALRANSVPTDPRSWSYLAPEQLEGTANGAFTDVHAVGLLMFELISGTLPFEPVDNLGALVAQRARAQPRSLGHLAPGLPAWLVRLADRAVAVDPVDRPTSAAELAADLDRAAAADWGGGWLTTQRFRVERG